MGALRSGIVAVVVEFASGPAERFDLQGVLDALAEGVIVVDLAGNVVVMNRSFVELWRIPEALIARRDQGRLVAHLQAQLADPGRTHGVAPPEPSRALHAMFAPSLVELQNGRQIECSSRPQSAHGETTGVVWRFRDITVERAAMRASRTVEFHLRTIFEHSGVGMAEVTLDGRFLSANATLCQMLKMSREALYAMRFQDVTHPEDVPGNLDILHETIASGGDTYDLDKRYLVKDGSVIWVHLTVAIVRDPAGTPVRLNAVVRDVTERHRMADALTQSLRDKETLLQEIHHRVKNNLQIISSLLMLQLDQMPTERARAVLSESVHRVRAMALIHEQLYRFDSFERVDLGVYARKLTMSLQYVLAPSARVVIDAESIEVAMGRAIPIGLILNELVTNALKFGLRSGNSERVGPDVTVQIALEADQLAIRVRDAGPGLPADFDVNQQRQSLGLHLVRSLTRQLRGKLVVERDHGTTFGIVCPVLDPA